MSDKNFLSIAGEPNVGARNLGDLASPDLSYSDTLKFSNAQNGFVSVGVLEGGAEDCVDINNGSRNLAVSARQFRPRGKFVATIKGGSSGITLAGEIDGHGTEVDIDLGNQSDQSSEVTTRVSFWLTAKDESPITVRVWNAETPRLMNSHKQRYEFVFPSQLPLWARRALYFAYQGLKKVKVVK